MDQEKYDVFISYSRKDYVDDNKNVIPGNEVSKIKDALTNAGITYWFDEDGIYSGDKFAKVIVRNIKASRVFVFLSTIHSNKSEWTAGEISTAHMMKKKIIPVRIDESIYHDEVIIYLSLLSHIDYVNNPEKGRQELVRSINAYLTEEKRREEELERQRQKQEEERKKQEIIEKIETEIAALESQKTERKKTVLQKEQELKLAQIDLEECENKIQQLQKKLTGLRMPQANEQKVEKEDEGAEEEHFYEMLTAEELYENEQYEAAFPLLIKEVQRGNANAEYYLATMYWNGLGVKADHKEGYRRYEKWIHKEVGLKGTYNIRVVGTGAEGIEILLNGKRYIVPRKIYYVFFQRHTVFTDEDDWL